MYSIKLTVFKARLCIHDLLSYKRKAHLILQTGDCLKIFNHRRDNALWRHVLTGYEFYSGGKWHNLVTTLMQKFENLLYQIMLDIIVFCLLDFNMQYGLSAKDKHERKTPYSLDCQIMRPPPPNIVVFFSMRNKLSNIFVHIFMQEGGLSK